MGSGSYEGMLGLLAGTHQRLASLLRTAHQHRRRTVEERLGGARFAGLDELLRHLDSVSEAWAAGKELKPIGFLIERAIGDFETGIEATVSGQRGVVTDAMRDVSEARLFM